MNLRKQIREFLQAENRYKIILSFDATEEVESCIGINCTQMTNQFNGSAFDFEHTIQVSGFTYIEDDKDGVIRDQMCEWSLYKMRKFDGENIQQVLIDSVDFDTDESTHSFRINIRIFTQEN